MTITRSEIDQDVERAFDLLTHYQGFLCDTNVDLDATERDQALKQLEAVLREWLPRVDPADEPLISGVCAVLGDRSAARNLLQRVSIQPMRIACLQRLASSAFPSNLSPLEASARCRAELEHWRALLPTIRRRNDQGRCVDPGEQLATLSLGTYWSSNLATRPSRLGASYFLACACEVVAAAALQEGIDIERIQPALDLAQTLREFPDWTRVADGDLVKVLDEQSALGRRVETLLVLVDLVASNAVSPSRPRTAQPAPPSATSDSSAEDDPSPATVPAAHSLSVQQVGKAWHIRLGEALPFQTRFAGTRILQRLVDAPGLPIHVTDLADGQGIPENSRQDMMDETAIREIRGAIHNVRGEIDKKEKNQDLSGLDSLREQESQLREQLTAAFDHRGRTRRMNDFAEKCRSRVAAALRRLLDRLQTDAPDIHEHLSKYLHDPSGFEPCYDPTRSRLAAAQRAAEPLVAKE